MTISRRSVIATGTAFALAPTLAFGETMKVAEAGTYKLSKGILLEVSAPREVWKDIVIQTEKMEITLADYFEKVSEAPKLKDDPDLVAALKSGKPFLMAVNAYDFPDIEPQLAREIAALREGHSIRRKQTFYICVVLIYVCTIR